MADFSGAFSSLVEDVPVDTENNFFDKIELVGTLTKLDNVGGGAVDVVRDNPMLPRREP